MKKYIFLYIFILASTLVNAQEYYWVYFTDKSGTEFNPNTYFNSKAIDRRLENGISLYDISDYPLNENYKSEIGKLSTEIIGESRWFNSIAIYTTKENANYISGFSFVKEVVKISNDAKLASIDNPYLICQDEKMRLESQLSRMNCQTFSTGLSSGHLGGRSVMGTSKNRPSLSG